MANTRLLLPHLYGVTQRPSSRPHCRTSCAPGSPESGPSLMARAVTFALPLLPPPAGLLLTGASPRDRLRGLKAACRAQLEHRGSEDSTAQPLLDASKCAAAVCLAQNTSSTGQHPIGQAAPDAWAVGRLQGVLRHGSQGGATPPGSLQHTYSCTTWSHCRHGGMTGRGRQGGGRQAGAPEGKRCHSGRCAAARIYTAQHSCNCWLRQWAAAHTRSLAESCRFGRPDMPPQPTQPSTHLWA